MFRKNCVFFTIHGNPSLAYIAVRDLQSSQRNASVQSLLLVSNFLYNQYQSSAGEREVANFLQEFLEKNQIFYEHGREANSTNFFVRTSIKFKSHSANRFFLEWLIYFYSICMTKLKYPVVIMFKRSQYGLKYE